MSYTIDCIYNTVAIRPESVWRYRYKDGKCVDEILDVGVVEDGSSWR